MTWVLIMLSLIDIKARHFEKVGYEPEPIQWQIHEAMCDYRYVMVKGGNRSGKSYTAGMEGATCVYIPNANIWCVAPTYTLTDKLFGYVRKYGIDALNIVLDVDRMRPQPHIETVLKSTIYGKSTEKLSSLEAESVYLMLVDEFGFMNKTIWNRLFARLDQEGSRCLIIFTPKGHNQWVRQFWAEKENDKHWFTTTMPTDEMQHVSRQFIEDAEREFGGKDSPAYREQIRGEFVPYGTSIYPMFGKHNLIKRVIDKSWMLRVGTDVGWVHPTTAAFWGITKGDQCHKIAEYHKSYVTQKDNAIAIVKMTAGIMTKHDITDCIIYYPPEEPSFGTELRRAIVANAPNLKISVKSANNAVEDGIELVRRLLPTQMTFDPDCKYTVFNYQNYSHKPDSEQIQKINDDHCDADRYALFSTFGRVKSLIYKAY